MKDYFSRQAATYAAFRPAYPGELFAWVAALAPFRTHAWDCATGSGQAALGLAAHFDHVVATDGSPSQLAHAARHDRVSYCAATAEAAPLADHAVPLVTVAQALHWFDHAAFYAEVRRVLVPGGVLAVWSYGDVTVDDPEVNALVVRYNHETVGPWWPPERRIIDDGYRTIPFPFDEIQSPPRTMEVYWTLAELLGYLRSWSATTQYAKHTGRDPVDELEREVAPHWGDSGSRRLMRWPLHVRAGRVA